MQRGRFYVRNCGAGRARAPGPSSGGTRPTAPCSKRWRGAGRTSAVCTSAARRRSSTRGWRLWISKTACSPCSWTGRVKPTCWFITASSTTRPNCAPHWPPAGTASTGTPTPRYCSTLFAEWGRKLRAQVQRYFCVCGLAAERRYAVFGTGPLRRQAAVLHAGGGLADIWQ